MAVAKGRIVEGNQYIYTCGRCNGSGEVRGTVCTDCYSLDLEKLLYEFQVARGERYYALLKAILSIQGKAICDALIAVREQHGRFTPLDLGMLVIKFGWGNRMKPMAEWLEETHLMPAGMYQSLRDRGMKPGEVLAAARKKITEQENNNQ